MTLLQYCGCAFAEVQVHMYMYMHVCVLAVHIYVSVWVYLSHAVGEQSSGVKHTCRDTVTHTMKGTIYPKKGTKKRAIVGNIFLRSFCVCEMVEKRENITVYNK